MTEKDFEFLQKLMDQYEEEARKCKQTGSPLAGCVVLAAAMEASLLSLAYCDDTNVRFAQTYRQAKDKDLRNWNLGQLLDLANEMKWWPTNLQMGEIARKSGISSDDALKLGDVGYFADWLREVRDMIHPGRHLRLWSGVKVTRKFLVFAEEILSAIYTHLGDKVETIIRDSPEFKKREETHKEKQN
jgi:hypothetical protein